MTTIQSFSDAEHALAHLLLATRVAGMLGRKFEEDDWAHVYCTARRIPRSGWSNLNIDVMHAGLGVEHKMMKVKSDRSVLECCGSSLMHPAATRSIRVPPVTTAPDTAMTDVLEQYSRLIEERRRKVATTSPTGDADMRTGWLLWQDSLREFVYFEETMLPPEPARFYAEWRERTSTGVRKGSKNLWVFERATGRKRYSITTEAGAKIQPYFDVPPPDDPNLHYFVVQGEQIEDGIVRVWVRASTARELERLVGSLDVEPLSGAVLRAAQRIAGAKVADRPSEPDAVSIRITCAAYETLGTFVQGVSDEHCMQLVVDALRVEHGDGSR
jgi:hypothetical protein